MDDIPTIAKSRHRIKTTSCLQMDANDLQHLRQHFRIGCHNIAAFQPAFIAGHIGNDTAGFLHNQRACGNIPRFEVELEETVQTAGATAHKSNEAAPSLRPPAVFAKKSFKIARYLSIML